jgi:endonuclease III related protein
VIRPVLVDDTKGLITDIYQRLLDEFGERHWWPGESAEEVVIGAILTQSVSWKNVVVAISRLRENGLLSLEAIHRVDISQLAPLIKSTRFYNEKARKLKNFASWLFARYGGSLDSMFSRELWGLRQELLTVKGLGEETVDSILLYAGNKSIFVVDAYTVRIFLRLGLAEKSWRYRDYQEYFMNCVLPDPKIYNEYHAQIVRLGHLYCRKNNPLCKQCPLRELCDFASIA